MRGSTLYQVNTLFEQVKSFGESKYEAKRAFKSESKRFKITNNAQNMAERPGVYSYKTADNYRAEWRQCLQYVKDNFGVRDIERITGEHIKAYLCDKIERTGGNKNTIAASASALMKMGVALDRLQDNENNRVADFRKGIAEAQFGKIIERPEQTRAYKDPQAIRDSLQQDRHRVATGLTAEIGMRVTETSLITPNQLNDQNQIYYQSKGGQFNVRTISQELADRLRGYFETDGAFRVNHNEYCKDLKQAAFATGQEYQGTHGLRWSFVQENYDDFRTQGLTHDEACKEVSELMSHHREEITRHYLRR